MRTLWDMIPVGLEYYFLGDVALYSRCPLLIIMDMVFGSKGRASGVFCSLLSVAVLIVCGSTTARAQETIDGRSFNRLPTLPQGVVGGGVQEASFEPTLSPDVTSFATTEGGGGGIVALDFFTADHNVVANASGFGLDPVAAIEDASTILGGEREVRISSTPTTAFNATTSAGNQSNPVGTLGINTNSGVMAVLELGYDGLGDDPTSTGPDGLTPFDITSGGSNNFLVFEAVDADSGTIDITVELFSSDGLGGFISSTETQTFDPLNALGLANGFGSGGTCDTSCEAAFESATDPATGSLSLEDSARALLAFDLNSFTEITDPTNFSLADITAVEVRIETSASLDVVLDAVGFVPTEFTSVTPVPFEFESAVGLATFGLGAAWKLRKRKAVSESYDS